MPRLHTDHVRNTVKPRNAADVSTASVSHGPHTKHREVATSRWASTSTRPVRPNLIITFSTTAENFSHRPEINTANGWQITIDGNNTKTYCFPNAMICDITENISSILSDHKGVNKIIILEQMISGIVSQCHWNVTLTNCCSRI